MKLHPFFSCAALALILAGAPLYAQATTLKEFTAAQAAEKAASASDGAAAATTTAEEAANGTAEQAKAAKHPYVQTEEEAEDAKAVSPYVQVEEEAEDAQDLQQAELKKKEKEAAKAKKNERYAYLLSDSGYDYYLDLRATRWVQIPHGDEQILDTWVKLMPEKTEDEAAQDGTYTYPQKYYLAHYYIRPKTQQIQFLSELEVSGGRPDNTVQGRGYSAQNWESLTPDSIEDEIYHGALDRVKKQKAKKNPLTALTGDNGPKNLRDALEEYFRISL